MFHFSSPTRTKMLTLLGVATVAGVTASALMGGAAAGSGDHERPSSKKVLQTDDAPAAIGPYSQGISAGNTVYVSGQLPIDVAVGAIDHTDTIGEQTALSVQNIEAVLREARLDLDDVVSTTVYLADMSDFAEFNKVYAEHFGTQAAPARATVEVAELPLGAKVEISAIAVR